MVAGGGGVAAMRELKRPKLALRSKPRHCLIRGRLSRRYVAIVKWL